MQHYLQAWVQEEGVHAAGEEEEQKPEMREQALALGLLRAPDVRRLGCMKFHRLFYCGYVLHRTHLNAGGA